ncbi:MAG: Bax inhibitor-1/YccA family protein, partial [Chlorobiales bacterium]|nr:Bax inhibitor-1/YccA family protein [Chlorobiales bacterium]
MDTRTTVFSNYGVTAAAPVDVEKRVVNQVYVWMALGLALTAGTATFTAGSETMQGLIFGNPIVFFGLVIAELGLVFGISAAINKLSAAAASGLFFLYSALNGLTLASIFLVYSLGSIAGTFLVTAGMFGAMSLYGMTTKRDLTKFGSLAMMGLIGIIIAGVVNYFLASSVLNLIISVVGVVLFTGLT